MVNPKKNQEKTNGKSSVTPLEKRRIHHIRDKSFKFERDLGKFRDALRSLTKTQMLILEYFLARSTDVTRLYMKRATIAKNINCTEMTVKRATKRLHELGLVEKVLRVLPKIDMSKSIFKNHPQKKDYIVNVIGQSRSSTNLYKPNPLFWTTQGRDLTSIFSDKFYAIWDNYKKKNKSYFWSFKKQTRNVPLDIKLRFIKTTTLTKTIDLDIVSISNAMRAHTPRPSNRPFDNGLQNSVSKIQYEIEDKRKTFMKEMRKEHSMKRKIALGTLIFSFGGSFEGAAPNYSGGVHRSPGILNLATYLPSFQNKGVHNEPSKALQVVVKNKKIIKEDAPLGERPHSALKKESINGNEGGTFNNEHKSLFGEQAMAQHKQQRERTDTISSFLGNKKMNSAYNWCIVCQKMLAAKKGELCIKCKKNPQQATQNPQEGVKFEQRANKGEAEGQCKPVPKKMSRNLNLDRLQKMAKSLACALRSNPNREVELANLKDYSSDLYRLVCKLLGDD